MIGSNGCPGVGFLALAMVGVGVDVHVVFVLDILGVGGGLLPPLLVGHLGEAERGR